MTLIGTAIGALVALVPAALHPKGDRVKELGPAEKLALKVADLTEKFAALARTREQLVNHIALIERQLDAERALANHWRGEAQRFARELRLNREQAEAMYSQQQHAALAQYNQQAHGQSLASDRYCNCVPSRAQVWGAHGGLVQQLNDRGE